MRLHSSSSAACSSSSSDSSTARASAAGRRASSNSASTTVRASSRSGSRFLDAYSCLRILELFPLCAARPLLHRHQGALVSANKGALLGALSNVDALVDASVSLGTLNTGISRSSPLSCFLLACVHSAAVSPVARAPRGARTPAG